MSEDRSDLHLSFKPANGNGSKLAAFRHRLTNRTKLHS